MKDIKNDNYEYPDDQIEWDPNLTEWKQMYLDEKKLFEAFECFMKKYSEFILDVTVQKESNVWAIFLLYDKSKQRQFLKRVQSYSEFRSQLT